VKLALADEYRWALDCLSPYGRSFFEREVEGRSLATYQARLRALGFAGLHRVLDLACGLGQWAIALATLNAQVVGVDIAEDRLMLARMLARSSQAQNLTLQWARMEELPFEAGSFDGCFCYGAFMFGDGPRTLKELARVLRPGAPLYLNVTGIGWNVDRLLREGLAGRNPGAAFQFGRMLVNRGLGRDRMAAYTRSGLRRIVERHGFTVDLVADEGHAAPAPEIESFYPGRVLGLDGVFELVARRMV